MKKVLVLGHWYSGSTVICDLLQEHKDFWIMPSNTRDKLPEFLGYHIGQIDEIYRDIGNLKHEKKKVLLTNLYRILVQNLFSNMRGVDEDHLSYFKNLGVQYVAAVAEVCDIRSEDTKDAFLQITADYIDGLARVSDRPYVVFDQAVRPYSNPSVWLEVFRDSKLFVVERNILDQVADIQTNSPFFWVVRTSGDLEVFAKQQDNEREMTRELKDRFPDRVFIYKFEHIVSQYDQFVSDFFSELQVSPVGHGEKKKYFNPQESKLNIGKYKDFLSDDDARVLKSLAESSRYLY